MDETGVKLLLLLCRYNEQLMTSSCKETNLVMSYKLTFSVCCKLDSWSLFYFMSVLQINCVSSEFTKGKSGKHIGRTECTFTCLDDDTVYMLYWVIINKIYIYSFSANQVTLALCVTLIWHFENLSWSPALQTRIHSLDCAFSLQASSPIFGQAKQVSRGRASEGLTHSRKPRFTRPNRRACSQATVL